MSYITGKAKASTSKAKASTIKAKASTHQASTTSMASTSMASTSMASTSMASTSKASTSKASTSKDISTTDDDSLLDVDSLSSESSIAEQPKLYSLIRIETGTKRGLYSKIKGKYRQRMDKIFKLNSSDSEDDQQSPGYKPSGQLHTVESHTDQSGPSKNEPLFIKKL